MQVLESNIEKISLVAIALDRHILYLHYVRGEHFLIDQVCLMRDVPFYTEQILDCLMGDEECIIVCDSKEEMEQLFDQVRGDVTDTGTVYAATYDNDGELLNENT